MILPEEVPSPYQRFRYHPWTINTLTAVLGGLKTGSAIGQGLFGIQKFLMQREHMPPCGMSAPSSSSDAYATLNEASSVITGFGAGVVTGFSRIPAIHQQASRKPSRSDRFCQPGGLCFEDADVASCSSTMIGKFIVMCSFMSSFFVVVSSYLFGYTFAESYIGKAIDSVFLFGLIGALTAGAAWYSFVAYAVQQADKNGKAMGKAIVEWCQHPTAPNALSLLTVSISVGILISYCASSYFFVKHAIPLFPPTRWVFGDDEDDPYVKAFALFSLFPSIVTNLGTRIASVSQVVHGYVKMLPYLPKKMRHRIYFSILALIGAIDLITGAAGNNRGGVNVFCDLGFDLTKMSQEQRIGFEIFNILVFNIPYIFQNYTFTTLPMLKYWAERWEPGIIPPNDEWRMIHEEGLLHGPKKRDDEGRVREDNDREDVELGEPGEGLDERSALLVRPMPVYSGAGAGRHSLFGGQAERAQTPADMRRSASTVGFHNP